MRLPIYQVDAFTGEVFRGNPAAVVPLETWIADATMQGIAAENNLAETAFFVPTGPAHYHLRWFTPEVEVDLCGHATLAAAAVLYEHLGQDAPAVTFDTRSGPLVVAREGGAYTMDFPARRPRPLPRDRQVAVALGGEPNELWLARDCMAVFETEAEVRALVPDMAKVKALGVFAMIATAPADPALSPGADFVSRFFAPAAGVAEDPVTGSAHCTLVPYWADRLAKTTLEARQVSRRGGALRCTIDGDRVRMTGQTVCYLEGTITV
ncbi:PhzF family phenazine biosynthesis protein [Luteitalea sp. TBR-22]|uniref:PhzF family phenazine biosynthesis protein n=1 Tax=Luteitalea sp. TBR-22 TaxID=2802971 RepID=UPI001EF56E31|nr:PhzF family phenazine biosynthesis protein [Luteitalea sp. TBR-22]